MQEQEPDKEELLSIAETLRGNTVSFGYIVDKYKDYIYNLCFRMTGNRHEAEDLTQEVFLKSFRNLKQYNVQYKFSNWLYTIGLNVVRNHLRRKKIISFLPFEKTVENQEGEETRYEASFGENDPAGKQKPEAAEKWTEKLVMALSPSLRPVFMLRHIYDLKYEEISSILEIPINTVKVHLNRARKCLYDKYYKEYNETFVQ